MYWRTLLVAAACLMRMHPAAAANDLYTVSAQVQNDRIILSPCSNPETVWSASFERAADEATVRANIRKYPPVFATRPHAGFFMRVIAEAADEAALSGPDTAANTNSAREPQIRLTVREILSLAEGSCHITDLLEQAFPSENTETGSMKETQIRKHDVE